MAAIFTAYHVVWSHWDPDLFFVFTIGITNNDAMYTPQAGWQFVWYSYICSSLQHLTLFWVCLPGEENSDQNEFLEQA